MVVIEEGDTARRWAESSAAPDIVAGFDQEATALLMARVSTFRVEHEETFDLLRWLDRTLIRVGPKFGEYQRDAPETFRMPAGVEPFRRPRTHTQQHARSPPPSPQTFYNAAVIHTRLFQSLPFTVVNIWNCTSREHGVYATQYSCRCRIPQ